MPPFHLETHLFSPTELESFLGCPFRFYAESILGLRELPETEPEMTPREIGVVIHRILEEGLKEGEWRPEKVDQVSKRLLSEFKNERPTLVEPLFQIQKKKIEAALDGFGRQHTSWPQDLKPYKLEWRFGQGPVPPLILRDPSNSEVIRLKGRIDRIDIDRERKRFLVIDYKTGSSRITGAAIERGESLQLPLYILAVKELLLPDFEPIGGLYYQFSDLSLKEGILHTGRMLSFTLHPQSSTLIPPERWEGLFMKTLTTVREIFRAIKRCLEEGHFPSRPEGCDPDCPFREVCLL